MPIPKKLPIKYKCGHTEKRDLSDVPAGKRKSRAQFYGRKFDCKKCYTASKDTDSNQRALDAESFAEEHDLPELEGSEAQLKWALIIRGETVSAVLEAEALNHDQAEVLEAAKQITWAGWWLDNLNWQDRKENDYSTEDYAELILTGPAAQAERDEHQAATATENPF